MRPRSSRTTLFSSLPSALLLLPTLAAGLSFNCDDVVTDGHRFNLSPLGGHHTVSHVVRSSPNVLNHTYTLDLCQKLGRDRDISRDEQCPDGTRVCSISNLIHSDGRSDVEHVMPIARQYEHDGARLEPKLQILPDSSSNADSEKEGVRVTLSGGKDDRNGNRGQKAVIEFLCPSHTGGSDKGGATKTGAATATATHAATATATHAATATATHAATASTSATPLAQRADEDDEGDSDSKEDDPAWEAMKSADDGHGGTLKFLSYVVDDGTLHLEWVTKYACRDYDPAKDEEETPGSGGGSSGGWGFFSWIFFLGFMGLIFYFGFFAWINYTKYGASGWDLVPHADTIRDVPYVLGDWSRKVVSSVTGGPSRGGYSAV